MANIRCKNTTPELYSFAAMEATNWQFSGMIRASPVPQTLGFIRRESQHSSTVIFGVATVFSHGKMH